ncbi:hypothetical protein C8J57DRAFT_1715119 [Mycena rebaudengoi]|nr:hypothetical protein C8J57DRAFT_1715119 [Mycena rebaudengoi]
MNYLAEPGVTQVVLGLPVHWINSNGTNLNYASHSSLCRCVFCVYSAGPLRILPELYASLLALLSTNTARSRQRLIRHVNTVLFAAFAVYTYRDIFPLATFTRVPDDLNEGPLLWVKISLLFVTAVVVPLFTPRQYIPVDPLNPMEKPNPELTASIISFIFFSFLDGIIFRGYRNSQLTEEDLYPLCDTETRGG